MKIPKIILILLVIFSYLTAYCLAKEDQDKTKIARKIIGSLQSQLFDYVHYSPKELLKFKEEFQEYYSEDIEKRLENISQYISSDAIHWIDVDMDDKDELIFWTEGLAPTAWGAKEYLFIVKLYGGLKIMKSYPLDPEPTRNVEQYKHSNFWEYPNKNKGYNDHLRAVFSYGNFGASGSTFVNLEIGCNRYNNELYIDKFLTSFPIAIDTK